MSIETPRGAPNIPQISPATITDRGTIPTSLDLWRIYERPSGFESITVVQYVYTGQIDVPISSLAVNEGQALRYCTVDEIDQLSIAYGFDSLLREYFAGRAAVNNGL